ncbi:MAG: PaaI family thioesterase [Actinomycetota bacterium]|nr:PaaI family thioesterase [Actinomycetota bacterium]
MNGEPAAVAIDRVGVGRCFGCGQANEGGLRLKFFQLPDGVVETRHRAASHHCGLDTVVHGGIQATILDEVMGVAAQLALPTDGSNLACVTVEMMLSYRRPVPMDEDVVARGWHVRNEGRDLHVGGAIVAADGTELTVATSRWRQLRQL